MTPESTKSAANFLMENTRLSINNATAELPNWKYIGAWFIHWDHVLSGEVSRRERRFTHAELEALARSIGWKGEGEE